MALATRPPSARLGAAPTLAPAPPGLACAAPVRREQRKTKELEMARFLVFSHPKLRRHLVRELHVLRQQLRDLWRLLRHHLPVQQQHLPGAYLHRREGIY